MRWVALIAVLANVLLAVWYFVIVRPAEQVRAGSAADAAMLVQDRSLPEVRLLGELDAAERASQGVAPLAGKKKERRAGPAECLLVGPVPEKVTALQLKQRFDALGLDADFRIFEVKLAPGYWVYLPPYPSEEATRDVLRKLRAANIDSFYVAEGEFKGGISLGVFSQEASAQQVQQERTAQGYPAVVRTVTRSRPEIWVAFREAGPLADEAYWLELTGDFPGLSRRTVSCGAVASAEKLP